MAENSNLMDYSKSSPDNPALLAINLLVRPVEIQKKHPYPVWWGKAAHKCFLDMIAAKSPPMAEKIHNGLHQPRPFTASSLLGYSHERLFASNSFGLRFTILTPEISGVTLQALSSGEVWGQNRVIELDHTPFRILENSIEFAMVSYKNLLVQPSPGVEMIFKFISPTGFTNRGSLRKFSPEPISVYQSLIQRWQEITRIALPVDMLMDFIANHVVLASSDCAVETIKISPKISIQGFKGEAKYVLTSNNAAMAKWLHCLGLFSNYCGVGAKTSWGFGQCVYHQG
jgi:CRISPR-associated endoribonuclease Cas6